MADRRCNSASVMLASCCASGAVAVPSPFRCRAISFAPSNAASLSNSEKLPVTWAASVGVKATSPNKLRLINRSTAPSANCVPARSVMADLAWHRRHVADGTPSIGGALGTGGDGFAKDMEKSFHFYKMAERAGHDGAKAFMADTGRKKFVLERPWGCSWQAEALRVHLDCRLPSIDCHFLQ